VRRSFEFGALAYKHSCKTSANQKGSSVKRFTFAVFALAVFSAPAFAADCAKDYKEF